jgi:hypothetical protein
MANLPDVSLTTTALTVEYNTRSYEADATGVRVSENRPGSLEGKARDGDRIGERHGSLTLSPIRSMGPGGGRHDG